MVFYKIRNVITICIMTIAGTITYSFLLKHNSQFDLDRLYEKMCTNTLTDMTPHIGGDGDTVTAGYINSLDTYCVLTKRIPTFWICTHDPSIDRFISAALIGQGFWEPINTQLFISVLRKYPNATIVDIGANIGYYTILSATLGHHVVAVEPAVSNALRLLKGAKLNGVLHKITLANVAASDKRQLVTMSSNVDNQGGLEVVHLNGYNFPARNLRDGDFRNKNRVCSVTMDDLKSLLPSSATTLIIKIDIEAYECKAMRRSRDLLTTHHVPYIFMEWRAMFSRQNLPRAHCTSRDMVLLARFLTSLGYTAHDITYGVELDPTLCARDWRIGDVYWRHMTAL